MVEYFTKKLTVVSFDYDVLVIALHAYWHLDDFPFIFMQKHCDTKYSWLYHSVMPSQDAIQSSNLRDIQATEFGWVNDISLPTQNTSIQHSKSNVASCIWINCLILNKPTLDIRAWGSSMENHGLVYSVWTTLPKVLNA